MNWAGGQGFAQSFLGTLQGLTAMERAQLQMEEMRQQQAERKAFRGVIGEEMGRVGQTPETSTGAIRSALGGTAEAAPGQMSAIPGEQTPSTALREAAGVVPGATAVGAQATAIPASTTPVTREDAIMNVFNRGMSVAPELTFDFVLKGLQLEDVLDTRQKKKAFQKDLVDVRNNMMELQSAAADAENNPEGVFTAAKKFGITLQPIATSPTTVAYEAYKNGQKLGQFNSLGDAASMGVQAYTTKVFGDLALKHSVDPKDMVSVLNTLDQMSVRGRELGIKERQEERAEQLLPEQINQIRASIRASDANARKAGVETVRLERMQDMNKQLEELLKDPKKNAAEILALTARMEVMFPEVYTKSGTIADASGVQTLTTTGILTPAAGRALRAGGVVSLPRELQPVIQAAADRAKGDPKKFAADRAIKNIVGSGKATIADLLEAANIKPAAEAIPTKGGPAGGPTTGRAEDFSNIFFSRATPRSLVERAAQAGNREAIAELEKRRTLEAAREAMPSNRGAFTP